MTVTSAHPRLDPLPAAILAMTAVWAVAVAAGLYHPAWGAVAAVAGSGVVAWRVLRRPEVAARADGAATDPGVWGLVLMAASPLVPARLGPSVAGIGIDDIPMIVGTLLASVSVVRREGPKALLTPIAAPLYLFAAWSGISTVFGGDLDAGTVARGAGRWLLVALAFSAAVVVARRPGRARWVFSAVLAVGVAEALFGIWAYLVDWAPTSPQRALLIGMERWREYQPLYGQVPGRVTGTLGVSSNFFGALMLAPVMVAAGRFAKASQRFEAVAYGIATAATLFALVLSYTRASVVALLGGTLFLLLALRRLRPTLLLVGLLVAASLLTPMASRFREGNDRLALAQRSLETIEQRPVTGLGAGDFVDAQFDEERPVLIATPHNSFLLAAAETGIPGGVLLFLAAAVPGAVMAFAVVVRRRREPMLVAATAALFAFGIQTFSNNLFHIPAVAVGYWLVAAAGLGVLRGGRPTPTGGARATGRRS